MYNLSYWFIVFIIYAFIGWIIDISDIYYVYRKIVNRGFLIGPYCPIYGVGVLLITFLLKNYTGNPLVLFVLATVLCCVLEYFTSYIMEVLFKARWWDYSDRRFNLNGRICLETTIPFGLGATLVMYVTNPFITRNLNKISPNVIIVIGIILMVLFLIDVIVSFFVISKIKKIDINEYTDDTEEVNNRVKEYLINSSPLMKRLIQSFPDVKIRIKKLRKKFQNKIKEKISKN